LCGIADKKVRQEALDTAIRAFTRPEGMEGHLELSLWQGKLFDPEDTRVAVAEGRAVSLVVLTPRMIRFGPVKVPAMSVGPVGTHDHYRKRGYSTAVMNDASARMKAKGILIAYLVGISGFYNRFGYYPFMARSSVKFFREPAETELRPGRLRAMTRKDLPSVRRLYDEVTARRICAAVRDDKVWDWLLRPGGHTWIFRVPKVILDARGRLCGYLTMEPKGELNIREIIVRQ
jgi:predicted acetyltransferase